MDFLIVAEYFQKIEDAGSRLEMTSLLSELFEKASPEEVRKLTYLSQAKLCPDFEGLEVGMGEKFVIQSIAKISGHSKEEINKLFLSKGDLGIVTMSVLKDKKQSSLFSEKLSLEKVFSNFLKIANVQGFGSQELKQKLLAELLNSASPIEGKFLARIPLQNLRLGIGDPTIMDSLAIMFLDEFRKKEKKLVLDLLKKYKKEEDVERQLKFKIREKIEKKYNIHPDLGEISFLLKKNGLNGLDKIEITIGIPIRPTLAERLPNAEEIIEKLGNCLVEQKLDGFRFQIHKSGDNVIIFSRKQENMTEMFPDIVEAVKKQVNAKEIIMEGEALAVKSDGSLQPFQITIQRKRKYSVEEFAEKLPLKLFVFDLMFLDGKNIMEKPFNERRNILSKTIVKGKTIELTKAIETNSQKELMSFFNNSISSGLEGIIAKDLNAKYIAGARKFSWIKLKESYQGEITDTIDVVIIGFDAGAGKRTKFGLGSVLTAVYNVEADVLESVARVSTGFTEQQLIEFEEMLSKEKIIKKSPRVLSNINPDFWVEPRHVIEVNADEITKSPTHLAGKTELGDGLALRFPRFIQLRIDKNVEEATTTNELINLFEQQSNK